MKNIRKNDKKAKTTSKTVTENIKEEIQMETATNSDNYSNQKKLERKHVRFVSPTNPKFWIRMQRNVAEKHGAPFDQNGEQMVLTTNYGTGRVKGEAGPSNKERRAAEKAAEAQRLASMSDEEKLAYTRQLREERAAAKAAKQAAERDALIEQIKADIAAGKI